MKATKPMPVNPAPLTEFEALYARYHSMVRAVVFNMLGARSGNRELDDLVQETFVRIWKGMSHFRGEAAARTWIYRITVNVTLDYFRQAQRRSESTIPDRAQWISPLNQESDSMERELIQKGLNQLSVEHRAVLVLHSFEGLSVEAIAEVLEIAQGTVRSRLYYAQQSLMKFLTQQGVVL